jgi:hypothetical protein
LGTTYFTYACKSKREERSVLSASVYLVRVRERDGELELDDCCRERELELDDERDLEADRDEDTPLFDAEGIRDVVIFVDRDDRDFARRDSSFLVLARWLVDVFLRVLDDRFCRARLGVELDDLRVCCFLDAIGLLLGVAT